MRPSNTWNLRLNSSRGMTRIIKPMNGRIKPASDLILIQSTRFSAFTVKTFLNNSLFTIVLSARILSCWTQRFCNSSSSMVILFWICRLSKLFLDPRNPGPNIGFWNSGDISDLIMPVTVQVQKDDRFAELIQLGNAIIKQFDLGIQICLIWYITGIDGNRIL